MCKQCEEFGDVQVFTSDYLMVRGAVDFAIDTVPNLNLTDAEFEELMGRIEALTTAVQER